jgi:hypothetical protein
MIEESLYFERRKTSLVSFRDDFHGEEKLLSVEGAVEFLASDSTVGLLLQFEVKRDQETRSFGDFVAKVPVEGILLDSGEALFEAWQDLVDLIGEEAFVANSGGSVVAAVIVEKVFGFLEGPVTSLPRD